MTDRLVHEGEDLDGKTLIAAQGDRRWLASRVVARSPLRHGYAAQDAVYALNPRGGDTFGFGGVKRIIRSEHEIIKNGWRVIA